jgi:hypothetical protein
MTMKRIVTIALAVALTAGVGVAAVAIARSIDPPSAEKVTVHGQWTIVVRDQRGAVVARREFENALVSSGAGVIASLLVPAGSASQASAGSWGVNITCCAIVDSFNTASNSPPFYKNLVVTAPTSGPDANKLVLSGSATPTSATTITNVDTYLGTCTGAPGCTAPANPQFSHKALDGLNGNPAPVPVAAGQQVIVTVKFSFS